MTVMLMVLADQEISLYHRRYIPPPFSQVYPKLTLSVLVLLDKSLQLLLDRWWEVPEASKVFD